MRKIIKLGSNTAQPVRRKRVATYARVSSWKDAMLHSLSSQISYHHKYSPKRETQRRCPASESLYRRLFSKTIKKNNDEIPLKSSAVSAEPVMAGRPGTAKPNTATISGAATASIAVVLPAIRLTFERMGLKQLS